MKRIKIPLLYILSFILSILPVSIYFALNTEKYIKTVPEGIKLTSGIIILLFIVFLKAIDKLKLPSRMVLFGLVFILSYLLNSVLNDMLVFSFLALIGELLDSMCRIFIKRAKAERLTQKTAEKTAEEIKKVLNGRV